MKHIIEIDDNSKTAKSLIVLLNEFSKTHKGIHFLSTSEVEDLEDVAFGEIMSKSRTGKLADKNKVLGALGL